MFKGSIPALVTPFKADGALDELAFSNHAEWQINEGSHGLAPVGTTGESPTLSHDEHKRVVDLCVEVAAKRVPVIAGAGSNNTREAIELGLHAEKAGADALLVVTPYYNKPTQKGLFAHFAAIAESVSLPIIIYNIPPRSVIDMSPETMGELTAAYSNIIGVKDATAKLERVPEQRMACGKDFIQLSGEDATALGFAAHGGVGCISVSANVAPKLCSQFQNALMRGDFPAALVIQDKLMPLHKALFIEPGVCGTKYALKRIGRIGDTVRLPLLGVEEATARSIDSALQFAELID